MFRDPPSSLDHVRGLGGLPALLAELLVDDDDDVAPTTEQSAAKPSETACTSDSRRRSEEIPHRLARFHQLLRAAPELRAHLLARDRLAHEPQRVHAHRGLPERLEELARRLGVVRAEDPGRLGRGGCGAGCVCVCIRGGGAILNLLVLV